MHFLSDSEYFMKVGKCRRLMLFKRLLRRKMSVISLINLRIRSVGHGIAREKLETTGCNIVIPFSRVGSNSEGRTISIDVKFMDKTGMTIFARLSIVKSRNTRERAFELCK